MPILPKILINRYRYQLSECCFLYPDPGTGYLEHLPCSHYTVLGTGIREQHTLMLFPVPCSGNNQYGTANNQYGTAYYYSAPHTIRTLELQ